MSDQRKHRELLDLLAGRLTEEERERLEDELLTDDDLFAELAGAEDDLVDAFVRGDLDQNDERVLERLVVGSERMRESAELGAALSAYPAWRRAADGAGHTAAGHSGSGARRWVSRALIALFIIWLAMSVVWSVRQSRERDVLERRLESLRFELEQEQERAQDLARRLAREEAENRLMRSPE